MLISSIFHTQIPCYAIEVMETHLHECLDILNEHGLVNVMKVSTVYRHHHNLYHILFFHQNKELSGSGELLQQNLAGDQYAL